jgi:hypothetical protein
MIEFSNDVKYLFVNNVMETETLIKIDTGRYETTAPVDIVMDGLTYTKHSTLIATTQPQLSDTLDSSEYTLQFSDSGMVSGETAGALQNALVEVYYVFYDSSNGTYLKGINDRILVYKGRVNSATYAIETDEIGESTFTITCGSPVSNLEMVKSLRSSRSFVRENIRNDDTCFDQMYEGSGVINLRWGKK